MKVKVKQLHVNGQLPLTMTAGAAGSDVYASESITIPPHTTVLVPLGIAVEVPEGFEIQCRPRSGFGAKGIIVTNSPGTIDSDYRGECKVILHNLNNTDFQINAGDRVAQFVLAPVVKAEYELADELSSTERGAGGFGSTGKR
jgi:dUTP pyrophosphatase